MKTVRIYGASDDLIETEGIEGCDEFNVYSEDYHHGMIIIESKETKQSLTVHAIYNGYWCFAVGTTDGEDYDHFPDWKIVRQQGSDIRYSESVLIDVPDDSRLTFISKDIDGNERVYES